MNFNETFNEFMNLYTEGHMGSAMRNLDRISGQQDADKLYGAIHAEVQKGKSVEEVLKDMNYAEKNYNVMVNSYNNWLASKTEVEDGEMIYSDLDDDIDEDTISDLAAIDYALDEGATVADIVRDYGAELMKMYIDYRIHPARQEDAEDKTGEEIDEFHKALDELVHKYLGHSSDETEGDAEDNQDDLENRIQDALAAGHIDQSDAREIRRLGEFSEREEDAEGNPDLFNSGYEDDYEEKITEIELGGDLYEVGSPDPKEGGIIVEIEKHANGYMISAGEYNSPEDFVNDPDSAIGGYGYALTLDGQPMDEDDLEDGLGHSEDAEEDAEGKIDKDRMKCNSPRRTSGGSKKFVVKACKDGKEKVVRFGDPNMKIKKSNPKRRKSFRARHKCDQKKDKFSAGYWSCKKW